MRNNDMFTETTMIVILHRLVILKISNLKLNFEGGGKWGL